MKDSTHTLIYALVLGLVCSLLLTGVNEVTKPFAESNREAERIRHVFGVLGVEYDKDLPSKDLVALNKKYMDDKTIREEVLDDLKIYVYAPVDADPSTHRKAVLFEGSGLWGPVKGFLALDIEMTTIQGITFHEQEETPGLGGEIVSDDFCKQFIGLKLEDAGGNVGIRIVKPGTDSGDNVVDGITSATMTCDKVASMLNGVIKKIKKERKSNGR